MVTHALYRAGRSRILVMLAIIAVAATALFTVAAQAAPKMPAASITLAGVAQARTADVPVVPYGSYVEFDYTLDAKMGKNNYLTINVECVQGDTVVYKRSGQTTQAFHMYAQGGNVYSWNAQQAECTARLRYYAHHRLNIVASTPFTVAPRG